LKALLALALAGRPRLVLAEEKTVPVLWRGAREVPHIAITFDDCFFLKLLQQLEKLLDDKPSVKVTFFPVGLALLNTIRKDADLWKRLRQSGHEIDYHTYDHRHPSKLTSEELQEDYDKWLAACEKALGEEPTVRFARPPYGERSQSFLDLCADRELILAMWSRDWSCCSETVPERLAEAKGGDIALMHIRAVDIETAEETLALLPAISLRAVGLSELYFASRMLRASQRLPAAWWRQRAGLQSGPGMPLGGSRLATPIAAHPVASPDGKRRVNLA